MRLESDQEHLIPGNPRTPKVNPIALYLSVQIIPIFFFLILIGFGFQENMILILSSILIFFSFWFIKSINGLQLIGLSWSINPTSGFSYYSKPDPYVPKYNESNAFWLGFFIMMVFWVISFVISLFGKSYLYLLLCIFGFSGQLINLLMFMRAHKEKKIAAEHAALEILQGEKVNFELVSNDSDDLYDSNQNQNQDSNPPTVNTLTLNKPPTISQQVSDQPTNNTQDPINQTNIVGKENNNNANDSLAQNIDDNEEFDFPNFEGDDDNNEDFYPKDD